MIANIGTLSIMVRRIVATQAGRRDLRADAWKVVQQRFDRTSGSLSKASDLARHLRVRLPVTQPNVG
jgi:hypothetical protein